MSEQPKDNTDQKEFWSGPSGQSWVTHQAEQDAFMADVLLPIAARAKWSAGDKVLDIGCGAGALSMMAADAVGPGGHVLATDISAPLLEATVERAAGLTQVQALLADAAETDWPAADYDIAVSRFGVMFFAKPAKAFANIMRALRPDGRIVFATWAPVRENPYWILTGRTAAAMLGEPPKVPPNTPGPFGMALADQAMQWIYDGGFRDVGFEEVEVPLRHSGGAKGLADLSVRIGPGRRAINHFDATEDQIDALRTELAKVLAPFETQEGEAQVPALLNIFTARKP